MIRSIEKSPSGMQLAIFRLVAVRLNQNNELEGMWKESFVDTLMVPPLNLL
jgi:hypothetical protein